MRPRSGLEELVRFLVGVVLSLLPERYRSRLPWGLVSAPVAIASGILQMLAAFGLLIYRYVVFFNEQFGAIPANTMVAATEQGGDTAVRGLGLIILVAYLLRPLSLLLIYFVIEGLVRVAAAIISSEIVPTLPLQLMALAHARIIKSKYERDLGPLVEDLVSPGAGDFALCIASCRPKPWTPMTTIAYEDRLYELAREDTAEPPRRWVYVLRKRPEHKIVRGEIYQYRQDELLARPDEKPTLSGGPDITHSRSETKRAVDAPGGTRTAELD